ncbi:hypothetical protein LR48_Vigan538s000700 [Vigna angularis]|uniref:Uncharacterized protein n=1 Tax=Phaseolus angularis TaxID=3914 RepID=A0A0L9TDY4_PHAAN|nr:uncharacterized protein HKW66_Vig0078900 [Vigna angularis]KOM28369.1 hypothetical protein LR48_Vigan538s000700 [Vigna angularis]
MANSRRSRDSWRWLQIAFAVTAPVGLLASIGGSSRWSLSLQRWFTVGTEVVRHGGLSIIRSGSRSLLLFVAEVTYHCEAWAAASSAAGGDATSCERPRGAATADCGSDGFGQETAGEVSLRGFRDIEASYITVQDIEHATSEGNS